MNSLASPNFGPSKIAVFSRRYRHLRSHGGENPHQRLGNTAKSGYKNAALIDGGRQFPQDDLHCSLRRRLGIMYREFLPSEIVFNRMPCPLKNSLCIFIYPSPKDQGCRRKLLCAIIKIQGVLGEGHIHRLTIQCHGQRKNGSIA